MLDQGGRPPKGALCCRHLIRWLVTQAIQDHPEVRLSLVKAPIANGLAVTRLLAVGHGNDLEGHEA
jgi:hypothetical protein